MEKLGERKIAHIINGHIRKEDLQPWPSGQKHPADAAVRTLLAWLRSARVLSFMDGAATQLEHAPYNKLCGGDQPFMTSEERREARYQRRVRERQEKRLARSKACGDFEQVFSYALCRGRGER